MDASKRAGDAASGGAIVKRARFENGSSGMDEDSNAQQIVVSSGGKGAGQLVASIQRTSGLQAPIVSFAGGHDGEILDIKFSASGETLATAGVDKRINLWKVYGSEEDKNYAVLKAQNGAITSLAFPASGNHLMASSTDKTVVTFDVSNGEVVRRHRGHQGIVNDVDVTRGGNRELIASASDDGLIKIWDLETKEAIDEVELGYPVTSVKWSQDGQQLFIGGIDNDIHVSLPPASASSSSAADALPQLQTESIPSCRPTTCVPNQFYTPSSATMTPLLHYLSVHQGHISSRRLQTILFESGMCGLSLLLHQALEIQMQTQDYTRLSQVLLLGSKDGSEKRRGTGMGQE